MPYANAPLIFDIKMYALRGMAVPVPLQSTIICPSPTGYCMQVRCAARQHTLHV
ncbi:hypothetical protein NIES22_61970 [Calothrix brevissima NIES-22]|nr:hypothetical protein NIES22_61970 [Calothrix brevissima NIES-22]